MPKDKKSKWSWSRLFGGGRKNSQTEQRTEPARQQLEEGDLEFEVLEELERKPAKAAENDGEYFGFEVLDELEQVKEVEISEMPMEPEDEIEISEMPPEPEDEIEISEIPLDLEDEIEISEMPLDLEDEIEISEMPLEPEDEIEMGENLVSLFEEIEIAAGPLEIDIDGITDDLHIEDTFDEEEYRKESRKRREERRQARGPQERTELDDLLDELEKQPSEKKKRSMSFKEFQAEDKTERRMKREKEDISKMPLAKQKTTEKTDKKEMNLLAKK